MQRIRLVIATGAALTALLASTATAATPTRLYLGGGAAFAVLGHSCGGIQQKVYATGFARSGYPTGVALLSTRCGGSGRGGGGHTTTYTGSANVTWTWFGETLSYSSPATGTANPTFSAEDPHHDRIYNENGAAYLVTGQPPLSPPGAPTGVSASVGFYEVGESEALRMSVSWTVAPATAALLKYSTITATPLNNAAAPVLKSQVIPYFSSGYLQPLVARTTYSVTVTSTDSEGTGAPSTPVKVTAPSLDELGG